MKCDTLCDTLHAGFFLSCGGNVLAGLWCVFTFTSCIWVSGFGSFSALSICFDTDSFLFFLGALEEPLPQKLEEGHKHPAVEP